MKIIVDAMGGDNAPIEIVKGAIAACEEYGVDIILTGRGEEILRTLEKMGRKELPKGIEIANANEVIAMEDDPVAAVREKKDSSMIVGLAMLRDGLGDAISWQHWSLLSGSTLYVRVRGTPRSAGSHCSMKRCVLIDLRKRRVYARIPFSLHIWGLYAQRVLRSKNPGWSSISARSVSRDGSPNRG